MNHARNPRRQDASDHQLPLQTRPGRELHALPRGSGSGRRGHRGAWPASPGSRTTPAVPCGGPASPGGPRGPGRAPLGHFAAAPGAAPGRALGRAGGLHPAQAAPLVAGAGGERVGAAVHHPGVQPVGHGEGLEVAPQGHGQWQLVHQVHGRAGHHRSAAQVLQAQDWGKQRPCLLLCPRPGPRPGQPARLRLSLPGLRAGGLRGVGPSAAPHALMERLSAGTPTVRPRRSERRARLRDREDGQAVPAGPHGHLGLQGTRFRDDVLLSRAADGKGTCCRKVKAAGG